MDRGVCRQSAVALIGDTKSHNDTIERDERGDVKVGVHDYGARSVPRNNMPASWHAAHQHQPTSLVASYTSSVFHGAGSTSKGPFERPRPQRASRDEGSPTSRASSFSTRFSLASRALQRCHLPFSPSFACSGTASYCVRCRLRDTSVLERSRVYTLAEALP
jgi:hypothetical protein